MATLPKRLFFFFLFNICDQKQFYEIGLVVNQENIHVLCYSNSTLNKQVIQQVIQLGLLSLINICQAVVLAL